MSGVCWKPLPDSHPMGQLEVKGDKARKAAHLCWTGASGLRPVEVRLVLFCEAAARTLLLRMRCMKRSQVDW